MQQLPFPQNFQPLEGSYIDHPIRQEAMHPVPTILVSRSQHMSEVLLCQKAVRRIGQASCLLPHCKLLFGCGPMPSRHSVPALKNFMAFHQMRLAEVCVFGHLWHVSIFFIIDIICSKLEHIGTMLTKTTACISLCAPSKFGCLAIHDEEANLQLQSFGTGLATTRLLQLQSQVCHISTWVVENAIQQDSKNLAQVAIQWWYNWRSNQPQSDPCRFILYCTSKLFDCCIDSP